MWTPVIARYDVERDGTLSGPYDEGDVCLWSEVEALLRQLTQAIAELQAERDKWFDAFNRSEQFGSRAPTAGGPDQ